jgi:hypothetical protein
MRTEPPLTKENYFKSAGFGDIYASSAFVLFSEVPTVENKERWMELCEQASTEQDPQKLSALVEEINRLLIQKENRVLKMEKVPSLSPEEDGTQFELAGRKIPPHRHRGINIGD